MNNAKLSPLTDASTLAPLSSFGSTQWNWSQRSPYKNYKVYLQKSQFKKNSLPASMLTTDSKIFSTDWTGLHLSALVSYPIGSSPGACKIEMQTLPSGYTIIAKYFKLLQIVKTWVLW